MMCGCLVMLGKNKFFNIVFRDLLSAISNKTIFYFTLKFFLERLSFKLNPKIKFCLPPNAAYLVAEWTHADTELDVKPKYRNLMYIHNFSKLSIYILP